MNDVERAFRVLGLEVHASAKEVEDAFLDLQAVWHPDRFTDNPPLQRKAAQKLDEIENAYEILRSHLALSTGSDKSQPLIEPVRNRVELEGPARGPVTARPVDVSLREASLFDDAFAERISKPKRRIPIWLVVLMVLALVAVLNYLRQPSSEVKLIGRGFEPPATEIEGNEVRTSEHPSPDSDREELNQSGRGPGPAEGLSQDARQQEPTPSSASLSPNSQREAGPVSSLPAVAKVDLPKKPDKSRTEIEDSRQEPVPAPKLARKPQRDPGSPQDRVSPDARAEGPGTEVPQPAAMEPAAGPELARAAEQELADRAFQILRAKSAVADRLIDGAFAEFRYREWKAVNRGSKEVFVDLVAESAADARETHFVWSVNVDEGEVKPLSQAARDLEIGGRELK